MCDLKYDSFVIQLDRVTHQRAFVKVKAQNCMVAAQMAEALAREESSDVQWFNKDYQELSSTISEMVEAEED